jgi:two-component system sensor histidine kinase PilS (NtrC family)
MDPTHLRQVLWNLLLNAVQAVDDGGQIAIKVNHMKHKKVNIQITDNGCGIPADVVQTIFDPFYTTKPEGTGLGLSIVHRILEAYSSRLDVSTIPGSGTTVSFLLHRTMPDSSNA